MKEHGKERIGIIGAGNMGGALLRGLIRAYAPDSISVYDTDTAKAGAMAQYYAVRNAATLKILVDNSDIIILAVKPDVIVPVLEEIKSHISTRSLLVSIAAGIPISTLRRHAGAGATIVRTMPNTPALVGEGMTAVCTDGNATNEDMEAVRKIFQCVGNVLEIPEKLMDAATAVSGSGPAFVFTFIQALADGGVKTGISRDKALVMAAQTVLGAAKMVLEGIDEPMALRGRVASPGGTTIEGIHVLERAGFSGIVMDAVESAALKSKKLGEG